MPTTGPTELTHTTSQPRPIPPLSKIREETRLKFNVKPCLWQMKVVEAVLKGDKHVVSIAGTGMGKTLTFWMPLLFKPAGSIQIVVTPLNILGKQNVDSLARAGFKAIFINANSANSANFRAIENLEYQAVVINPEQLMKPGGDFERLLKNPNFSKQIISLTFDEAHCISAWGGFRPEYREIGRLRYVLPKGLPIVITSATLPELVLKDVLDTLELRKDDVTFFRRSSDRPNIHLVVKEIRNSLSSFLDLKFVLKDWKPGDSPPPKFLVFFDDINEAIRACQYIKSLLPREYRDKVNWFNSDMSDQFKEDETKRLIDDDSWGMFTTDSFGMGMDISNVRLVVQWRATCTLSTLWQRFGRGARDRSLEADAVFLVEKEHFDDAKKKKADRKVAKSLAGKKRRRQGVNKTPSPPRVKRVRVLAEVGAESSSSHANLEQDILGGESGSDNDAEDADGGDLGNEENREIELRAKYVNGTKGIVKERRTKRTIDPAMDDFINAPTRDIECRRIPLDIYFENKKALSDHMTCDSNGCLRCCIPPSRLCCDIDNPLAFERFNIPSVKTSRLPARSRIKSSKTMSAANIVLRDALEDWREATTEEKYGYAHFVDLGPCLVMPTEVLDRIVACTDHGKIETKNDLAKETRWDEVDVFGDEIVALIHRHNPPIKPPTTVTPLQPLPLSTIQGNSNNQTKERAAAKCSACGIAGHNKSNRMCSKRLNSTVAAPVSLASKENVE